MGDPPSEAHDTHVTQLFVLTLGDVNYFEVGHPIHEFLVKSGWFHQFFDYYYLANGYFRIIYINIELLLRDRPSKVK
jgi:hypothetical protein